MATRCLNKVLLIGNLTRDPELRTTPQGAQVCNFTIATNREWKTDDGQNHKDTEFHRVVAWNKLAEICQAILKKGYKVYVEGRLQTHKKEDESSTLEIIVSDVMLINKNDEQIDMTPPQTL